MYELVDCILNNTGVINWQIEGGSTDYISTTDMMGLSQNDRFLALCAQLEGPRPMTLRDMAEVQYIGLMFNVCVGAIAEEIVYDGDMTVGEVLDGLEAAINADEIGNNADDSSSIGSWKDYADNINNGLDLAAGDCAEGQAVFTGYGPCGEEAAPSDQGILLPSSALDVVVAQAYPNPVALGAGVTINYRIPSVNSGEQVTLRIFDTTGRLVTTLVQQSQPSGEFQATWNMVNDYGQRVPAGVYFYRLNVGPEVFTQKMMIVQR